MNAVRMIFYGLAAVAVMLGCSQTSSQPPAPRAQQVQFEPRRQAPPQLVPPVMPVQVALLSAPLADAPALAIAAKFEPEPEPVAVGEDAYTRGQAARQDGQWGRALLWYMNAAEDEPHQASIEQEIIAVRRHLLQQTGSHLVISSDGGTAAGGAEFASALRRCLTDTARERFGSLPRGHSDEPAPYTALVLQLSFDMRTVLEEAQLHTYEYQENQRVDNPRRHHLRSELAAAVQALERLRAQHRAVCPVCQGHGKVACDHCRGSGKRVCPKCGGRRFLRVPDVRRQCDQYQGRGWSQAKCGVCRGAGTVVVQRRSRPKNVKHRCDRCGGSGRVQQLVSSRPPAPRRRGRRRRAPAVCEVPSRTSKACARCAGSGKIIAPAAERTVTRNQKCRQCGGSGHGKRSACHRCAGAGMLTIKGVRRGCEQCRRSGHIACSHCGAQGRVVCRRCGGDGRLANVTQQRVHATEAHVRRLKHKLACEPHTIVRHVTATWPYTIEHYRRNGLLEACLTLVSNATGQSIAAPTITKRRSWTAARIDNARPDIGLHERGSPLPSESEVRQSLIEASVEALAGEIIDAATLAESKRIEAQAAEYGEIGDGDAALEASVVSAVLLELVGSEAGRDRLDLLRREQLGTTDQ